MTDEQVSKPNTIAEVIKWLIAAVAIGVGGYFLYGAAADTETEEEYNERFEKSEEERQKFEKEWMAKKRGEDGDKGRGKRGKRGGDRKAGDDGDGKESEGEK